jgi:hypothetical protein
LALQRVVNVENEVPISVGQIYQLENRIDHLPMTGDFIRQILSSDTPQDQEEVCNLNIHPRKQKHLKQKHSKRKRRKFRI